MKVKLSDVIFAIDMTNESSEFFLDQETGEIEFVSELTMTQEEQEEQEEINDRLDEHGFYRLPTFYEIDHYEIMEDFVETLHGASYNRLSQAIQGPGAFGRFDDEVENLGISRQWNHFQAKAYKEIAIAWCEENGIEYV